MTSSLFAGVQKMSQHERRGEPNERRWSENVGYRRPAKRLDPKAEHGRAGKLAEAAGLLQQADGGRHGGCVWGCVRGCRIERAWCKAADSERKRGDERDALRRKRVAINGKA